MAALKLGALAEERPVRLALELPAALHRDLLAYAAVHGREHGSAPVPLDRLVMAMVQHFMATDRGFAKARQSESS